MTCGVQRVPLAMLDLDHGAHGDATGVYYLNVVNVGSVTQREIVLPHVCISYLGLHRLLIAPLIIAPQANSGLQVAGRVAHSPTN